MIVEFRKTGKGQVPKKFHEGDSGFDLFISRKAIIPPNGFVDINSDIYMAMPPGLWARITGRSSTMRKYGLLVNEGIIDGGFRGELFVGVKNLNPVHPVELPVGARIAQLIFHSAIHPEWKEVKKLPPSERGTKGFGSSGK